VPLYLPVTLVKMSIDEMMMLANENFGRQNYGATIALTRMVLSAQPELAKAHSLLGHSLAEHGQYDEAATHLSKAINAGEAVSFSVLHRHGSSWNGKSLSPGRLTLHRESLEFVSTDFPDQNFNIPYSKIAEMSFKDQIRLNLKVRIKLSKNKKETDEEYNLYSTDAVATGRLITCPQCVARMRFLMQLLLQFRPAG
jgi:hypothetical protein